jgi:hypothetical protein
VDGKCKQKMILESNVIGKRLVGKSRKERLMQCEERVERF